MSGMTIYEFDALVPAVPGLDKVRGVHGVPPSVFDWLESQCLRNGEEGVTAWVRLTQRGGRRSVQVTSFVGVIRAPSGYQIEVLPKVGKAIGGGDTEARQLLIEMLRCLGGFRHIQTKNAMLAATRLPLLEVFIGEFLRAVEQIVKRGLRSDYTSRKDNLFALRGKLLVAQHLQQNLCRADRFFTEHDEYSSNRPENRLLHLALRCALSMSASHVNQQLARELCFVFADIPPSSQYHQDFQRVRLNRGMVHYVEALAWARLILDEESPLTGSGKKLAPSLLFPMEAVFEAFVGKHLARQLAQPFILKTQARSFSLVEHQQQDWFRLKPDFLVYESESNTLVLDSKWKLLESARSNGTDKYGLAQTDFYQMHAYGHSYLDGDGDVILIYPKTDSFSKPLAVFKFPKTRGLSLWVLPFCLRERRLIIPPEAPFVGNFISDSVARTASQAKDGLSAAVNAAI